MTSTFRLQDYDVPVKLPEGLSQAQVLQFHPFTSWVRTLMRSLSLQAANQQHTFHNDPYMLRSVEIQSFDLFGGKRLGFLKLKSEVTNGAGESLPGSVFLRGPSVAMLVMLVPDDAPQDAPDSERYVLLTVQPRIAAGSLALVELPAGMVDDEGQFAGTAAKEIKEELGMEISADELKCLSEMAAEDQQVEHGGENLPQGVYPSPGGCDEFLSIHFHERRVPREQLGEWTGRLTGLRDDGEKITLKLVKLEDLWREGARDAKCLSALALWQGLRREKKL